MKRLSVEFMSYLPVSCLEPIFAVQDRKWWKPLLLTSFVIGAGGEALIIDFEATHYTVNMSPSGCPYQADSPALPHIDRWLESVRNPTQLPGEVLVVIGRKGSMKSTATKFVCRKYMEIVNVQGCDRLRIGRVDSDTYGRWIAADGPSFSCWADFERFQDDESKPSIFESLVKSELGDGEAERIEKGDAYGALYARVLKSVSEVLAVQSAIYPARRTKC